MGWRILGCHCARKYLPRNARVRQAFTISDESVGSRTDSPNVGITRFHGAAVATRTNGLMTPVQSHAGETSSLSGDLNSDPNVRAAAAQDFGHLIYKQPRAVFRPAARPGIASLLRYAKQQGLKVAARGQGHSIYGRALAERRDRDRYNNGQHHPQRRTGSHRSRSGGHVGLHTRQFNRPSGQIAHACRDVSGKLVPQLTGHRRQS